MNTATFMRKLIALILGVGVVLALVVKILLDGLVL
jgi:hypothetical protein